MKKSLFLLLFLWFALTSCGTNNLSDIEKTSSNSWSWYSFMEELNKIKETTKTNKSFNSCMTTAIDNCNFTVVKEEAVKKSDEKICDELSSTDLKIQCKNVIVSTKALNEWNAELCKSSTNPISCYSSVIQKISSDKKDYKECVNETNKIKESLQKDTTWTGTNNQTWTVISPELIDSVKNNCIISFISSNYNNPEINLTNACSEINSSSLKTYCENYMQRKNQISNPTTNTTEQSWWAWLDRLKNIIKK